MKTNKKVLTETDFFNKYNIEYNQVLQKELSKQEDNDQTTIEDLAPFEGCMYETYGEEFERVKEVLAKSPKKIWTLIDNNNGWFGIVAGFYIVNRVGYLISENEWSDENEEYVIQDDNEFNCWFDNLPASEKIKIIKDANITDMRGIMETWVDLDYYEKEFLFTKYNQQ